MWFRDLEGFHLHGIMLHSVDINSAEQRLVIEVVLKHGFFCSPSLVGKIW